MGVTALAWRNWITEVGSIIAGSNFETEAPRENLLTPQAGEVATLVNPATGTTIVVQWTGGRPVDFVALINHNIIAPDDPETASGILITLYDDAANSFDMPDGISGPFPVYASSSDFQSHLYFFLPEDTGAFDKTKVEIIYITISGTPSIITGTKDPYTEVVTAAPFSAGGIWAGPLWYPTNGVRVAGLGEGITEQRRESKSIGGQDHKTPEPRARRVSLTFGNLPPAEVHSTDPLTQQSLQQMAAWCCTSRPLFIIPDATDSGQIYARGIYGYLDQDPSWVTLESTQMVACSLQATETL